MNQTNMKIILYIFIAKSLAAHRLTDSFRPMTAWATMTTWKPMLK